MILIRIQGRGRRRDVQSTKREVVLGSDAGADVVESDVGWAPREAVLVHRGTEVELRRGTGEGDLRLRLGDGVRLGHARITLVGLMPLPEEEAPPATAGAIPTFGGYEEGLPEPQRFQLVDELARSVPRPLAEPPPEPARPAPARAEPQRTPPSRAPAPAPAAAATPAAPPPRRKGVPPLPRPSAPGFSEPDFGEELVRQLKRAPFFMTSLALHALVFFVLTILQVAPDAGAEHGFGGTLQADLQQPADREQVTDDEPMLPSEHPLPLLDELPLPQLPDEEDDVRERTDDAESLEALPEDDPLPFTIGTNPSLRSVLSGTGRKRDRLSKGDLTEIFTEGDARSATEKAANYVRAELGRGTGREGDPLERLVRGDLLVVRGTFDHVGKVLEALRLPYLSVPARSMTLSDAPDLSRHKIVFWNCGESLPEEQQRIATRRIREFVKGGGFLFTTDWSVGNLLEHAFPGYLDTHGPRSPLPETVIDIAPGPGRADHPLLRGVFLSGVQGRWWLEQASYDVLPTRSDVTVLIESRDLEKVYHRSPAVAVTFAYGRGRVLHVVGHYYQEAGNLAGTISAQRLALNFVLMRLGED